MLVATSWLRRRVQFCALSHTARLESCDLALHRTTLCRTTQLAHREARTRDIHIRVRRKGFLEKCDALPIELAGHASNAGLCVYAVISARKASISVFSALLVLPASAPVKRISCEAPSMSCSLRNYLRDLEHGHEAAYLRAARHYSR